MTERYTQFHCLRTMDFDRYDCLQPSAVLELFQDAAAAHAGSLGMGFDDLRRRGLLWVVLRVYYEQTAQPKAYDEVQVQTWPHPPGVLDFGRDYRICAADGTELVRGTSQWAVIREDTRKLVPSGEVGFPDVPDDRLFPARLRKLPDFDGEASAKLRSAYTDLDHNGHVNNARYAGFLMNALRPGAGERIRSLQLDYHHEVLPDTELTLLSARRGGIARCKGCDAAGTLMFTGSICFETEEKE